MSVYTFPMPRPSSPSSIRGKGSITPTSRKTSVTGEGRRSTFSSIALDLDAASWSRPCSVSEVNYESHQFKYNKHE